MSKTVQPNPRWHGAILFLLVWLKFDIAQGTRILNLVAITDWRLIPIYWLVLSGLILGTFVDFEHLIIPDRVTLGGILAGLLLSALVPGLHGQKSIMRALLWSVSGVITGGGILWTMAIVGKMVFRKELGIPI